MRHFSFRRAFCVIALLVAPSLLSAGTLDDAPFSISVPNDEWKLEAEKAQPMGKDVFLVASLSNTNTGLKSVVIKTKPKGESEAALEELCKGLRDSLSNPAVTKISESDTTFLGHKAKTFIYEIKQGDRTVYNEAVVFIAEKTAWTIACVGGSDRKEDVKRMLSYYSERKGS